VTTIPQTAPVGFGEAPHLRLTSGLLLTLGLAAILVISLIASMAPNVLLAFGIGVPLVILGINPNTRFASLAGIFALAPLMPYLKAFTGIREGPACLDIAMVVLFIVLLGDHLLSRRLTLEWLELIVAAYIGLGALQLFNPLSPGMSDAVESFRRLVLPALGFFLGLWMVHSVEQVKILFVVLAAVSLLVAAYAVRQSISPSAADWRIVGDTVGSPVTYRAMGRFRAFSTLSSPFHLAFLMTSVLLLFFSLFAGRCIPRVWFVLGVPLLGAGSIVTIVRTGWVGTIVGLLTMFVLAPALGKTGALTRLILAAVAFAGLLAYTLIVLQPDQAMSSRFLSLGNLPAEEHYSDRLNMWRETIVPAIRAHPFGYGLGSDSTKSTSLFEAHNGYFYTAIEMGVIGVILTLVIMGTAFLRAYRGLQQRGPPLLKALHLWIACWTVALLVMATFGDLLYVYPANLYYWFFLGVVCSFARSNQSANKEEPPAAVEGSKA
jgi:O-antigen ligase